MSLKSKFREAQRIADGKGGYASALGFLERAVADYLGTECKCPDCGGVNRQDGQRCEFCQKRHAELKAENPTS